MPAKKSRDDRLIGLFLFGLLLFNYPLLAIFDVRMGLFGIPLFLFFIFSAWALFVVLIVLITASRPDEPAEPSSSPHREL
jgi:hypothetical protein